MISGLINTYLFLIEYLWEISNHFKGTLLGLYKTSLRILLRVCIKIIKSGPIPKHVAFIMDGNRRYARKQGIPVNLGHSKGYDKLEQVISISRELGIKEITLYAFSIENFKRSKEELDAFMKLVNERVGNLLDKIDEFNKNDICVRVIGNFELIPKCLMHRLALLILLTKNNKTTMLNIAFAYTSRDEIANAFQEIATAVQEQKINQSDIDEGLINKCMYSKKSRMPDILIRTSGEVRFSDFLLWQCHNTNIVFHNAQWPLYSTWNVLECMFYYQMFYKYQRKVEKRYDYVYNWKHSKQVKVFLHELDVKRFEEVRKYALNSPCECCN